MPSDPLDLLWLALLGGWVAVDGTSFGQFMFSRPLVASTIAGAIVGNPVAGAVVGVILEAFHLGVLPVGAARYPEAGPAATVAGAAYASSVGRPHTLMAVLAFALLWEWICGESILRMRHANVRILSAAAPGDDHTLERRHLMATALDFVRGMVLVLLGWIGLAALRAVADRYWGLAESYADLAVHVTLVVLLAGSLRLFAGRIPWFVAGIGCGFLLLLAR